MSAKSFFTTALLVLSGSCFAADAQLPNVFEVHFSIDTGGKTDNATAVVIEGAKAQMQTVSGDLRLQFAIASDEATSKKIGRNVGLVDVSVSRKQLDGTWSEYGHPSFSVILGSDKAASLTLSNSNKGQIAISARVLQVDSTQYADRIAQALSQPQQCIKSEQTIKAASAEKVASADSPTTIPDKCCCKVACPDGVTWTCCNVLSCSCGSNTCSPAGGWLCY